MSFKQKQKENTTLSFNSNVPFATDNVGFCLIGICISLRRTTGVLCFFSEEFHRTVGLRITVSMEKTEITNPSRPPYKLLLSCTAGLSPSPVLSLSTNFLIQIIMFFYQCIQLIIMISFFFFLCWVLCDDIVSALCKKLSVVFDQSYDRIPHPDTNLENSVSEVSC